MRQLVMTILILMFGAASPSAAQVYSGKAVEVRDASSNVVGHLVGSAVPVHEVSVVVPGSGEVAVLTFRQFAGTPIPNNTSGYWDMGTVHFTQYDCTGTAYVRQSELGAMGTLPSILGNYYVANQERLYRVSGYQTVTTGTILSDYVAQTSSYGCANEPQSGNVFSDLLVADSSGVLPYTFPFHIADVPPYAPLLPPWAFGTLAGGIVLSGGGAIVMRGRRGKQQN